ncbi:hypothetical protein BS17DRAFT_805642 [Gyrodon lividus]|nr:hypothetical protein BS17DRAFT_805642 [Gyrodon lividus]
MSVYDVVLLPHMSGFVGCPGDIDDSQGFPACSQLLLSPDYCRKHDSRIQTNQGFCDRSLQRNPQTVTVVLARYQATDIMPAFAQRLASLPNVAVIESIYFRYSCDWRAVQLSSSTIVHAHSHMTTSIKNAFQGKRFPSEVICNEDDGSTLVGAIVKGGCKKVQVLKGVSASLKSNFRDVPLVEHAADAVTAARQVLKENKSRADKFIIVTKWVNAGKDNEYMLREIVKVSRSTLAVAK